MASVHGVSGQAVEREGGCFGFNGNVAWPSPRVIAETGVCPCHLASSDSPSRGRYVERRRGIGVATRRTSASHSGEAGGSIVGVSAAPTEFAGGTAVSAPRSRPSQAPIIRNPAATASDGQTATRSRPNGGRKKIVIRSPKTNLQIPATAQTEPSANEAPEKALRVEWLRNIGVYARLRLDYGACALQVSSDVTRIWHGSFSEGESEEPNAHSLRLFNDTVFTLPLAGGGVRGATDQAADRH